MLPCQLDNWVFWLEIRAPGDPAVLATENAPPCTAVVLWVPVTCHIKKLLFLVSLREPLQMPLWPLLKSSLASSLWENDHRASPEPGYRKWSLQKGDVLSSGNFCLSPKLISQQIILPHCKRVFRPVKCYRNAQSVIPGFTFQLM